MRCIDPWIFFFSDKVAAQNLWKGNGRSRKSKKNKYSFKHYGRLWKQYEVKQKQDARIFRQIWKKAFTSSMRLKKCYAVFAVNFLPSHNVIEKTCKWALNILLITSYLLLVVLKDLWADLLAYNLCSNVVLLCQTQSHLLQNEFHLFTSFHWAICLNLFKQKPSTFRVEPAYFFKKDPISKSVCQTSPHRPY